MFPQSNALHPRSADFSLPLLKFSFATDSQGAAKFSWKHAYEDLSIMFDSFRSSATYLSPNAAEPLMMKVVQGHNILEHVDIVDRVQQSKQAIADSKKWNVQLRSEQLPTSALHRRVACTIALRYTAADGNSVRRIQLKFASINDFDTALSYFERIGCPLIASAPPSEGTASSVDSRPSTSTGFTEALRYASSEPKLDDSIRPVSSYASAVTHLESREPSSVSAYGLNNPTGSAGTPSNSFAVPELPQHVQHQVLLQRSLTSPRGSQIRRPSSAGNVATHGQQLSIGHAPYLVSDPATDQIKPDSFFPTSSPARNPSAQRPATAPMYSLDDPFADMIPPPRELPFSRPGSNKTTRPSSSSLDLPPLPKPKLVGDKSERSWLHDMSAQIPLQDTNKAKMQHVSKKRPAAGKGKAESKRPVTASSSSLASDHVLTDVPQRSSSLTLAESWQERPTPVAKLTELLQASESSSDCKENLALYAAQPYDLRAETLESLIAQVLEDENFKTLCEDVEGCWKRIGLER
ncbi:hypothetical protein NA57DRAFT_57352 [Rhizodiscina lignyota]|uniref:Uncharacterized protein n=1 Tax=Rhizodiscina lignyota TaxID=1504668 RepID=A0A9P4M4X8_9PEZI|nr:hypothetical protein NA57DRAFT_57352 [Rhizodiscina lignyota]